MYYDSTQQDAYLQKASDEEIEQVISSSISNKVPLPMYNVLKTNPRYLKKLKIYEELESISDGWIVQQSALAELMTLHAKNQMPYVIIKTIKTFPYVGSDIDVIVLNDSDFDGYIKDLIAAGYVPGGGSKKTELTMRKEINKFECLIDVHQTMSAGGIEYIPKDLFEDNIEFTSEGQPITTPELDLVILMFHSVWKEFTLPLSDIVHFNDLLELIDESKFIEMLSRVDFGYSTAKIFFQRIVEIDNRMVDAPEKGIFSRLTDLSAKVSDNFGKKDKIVMWIVNRFEDQAPATILPEVYPKQTILLLYTVRLLTKPVLIFTVFRTLFKSHTTIKKLIDFARLST